ncbi:MULTISPECIES: RIP metalloprotease RseP [Alkalihalophilus]|uniref:Zinc metalloprotease n=2 Tax=Alkalihalophilus TaxID=2893060 RepID=A0AAJ2L216_ALKPS|nr:MULTISPECIES: RIP metalloprotease RseP [Alkalihalophilus]ERN53281.1 metalloprotease RseP [Alkalihalophilus marmarensis DSM 21297]MCM3489547.1 RIP metalloprotease RseP [Alkalihalophilus marmarensis]MDV2885240.1 RIP metalloprotease RseP [Alkalihalophilus pseudofirmus]MEC2073140.1 RIP metalloprotease RseP [Alkalihalophilus marmarensis]OLS37505.1 RIP metalloprotease RseP [Alkalihalophilus pseudofirmus]
MNTLISFIVVFGLLVFIHEWGHLYFAKRAGILCREFAIGFGPKLFSFKRNETVYTIRMLPLGGFVRMAGEDPEMIDIKPGYEIGLVFNGRQEVSQIIINNKSKHPEAKVVQVEKIDLEHELFVQAYDDDELVRYKVNEKAVLVQDEQPTQIAPWNRQFGSKSVGQRALAIFAGPMMNFVLAFVLLAALALMQGIPVDRAEVGEIMEGGAAEEAGLVEGDQVTSIENTPVDTWEEMTTIIQQNPNESITFTVVRNGQTESIAVTPNERVGQMGDAEGFIGVTQPREFSVIGSLTFGVTQTYLFMTMIFEVLGLLVTGQFSLDYVAGPVGIYNYTGEAAALGIFVLMQWAAALSVNLGIINLLPIPAMDGGRLVFIGLEGLRGKPIDPQKEGMVHLVGFALLFLLVIFVTWNDINRLFM